MLFCKYRCEIDHLTITSYIISHISCKIKSFMEETTDMSTKNYIQLVDYFFLLNYIFLIIAEQFKFGLS